MKSFTGTVKFEAHKEEDYGACCVPHLPSTKR